uniref:(California timema) hypothetical protein n=1 Tax=Timema californicum TaxID=61474 RepID=A0A7R9IVB6_TIMCA|nr:unnamed protein product [Timema californicum]
MGSKVEYVESSHIYATNYIRNSKAIGVLWGIFTICYAIIGVVAFVTPEWIGETLEAEYPGRFGLWARCYFRTASEVSGGAEDCRGSLDDLSSIPSAAFKAATIFVGLSVVLSFLAICSMLLFFFFQSTTVFHICGWVQVLSGEIKPPLIDLIWNFSQTICRLRRGGSDTYLPLELMWSLHGGGEVGLPSI